MTRLIVLGAGGRAGRTLVTEALSRGHQVTAVVRDPSRYDAPAGVAVVAGDALDADRIAELAAGHDVAISTVADLEADATAFYTAASTALVDGLGRAGAGRLVVVGIATTLETAPGVRQLDDPAFPAEYLPFCNGHAAGLETLRKATTGPDWLVVNPVGDFDHDGGRTGRYGPVGTAPDPSDRISYPDFAVAVLDEIETPKHHRTQVGVAGSAQRETSEGE